MTHVADVAIQSSQVAAEQTDFPLLVDLSDLPALFWSTVANGGGDIRVFKSDGTTELPREVVSCDTATDTGELWVKFSGVLSGTANTTIQIHADGTSSDYAVTATYGRNNVWSDYAAVWHMSDTTDSTGNGNTLTEVGSPSVVDGAVGKGYQLNGTDQWLVASHSADLSVSGNWALQVVATADASSETTDTNSAFFDKSVDNNDAYKLITTDRPAGKTLRVRPINFDAVVPFSIGDKLWFSGVFTSSTRELYRDGSSLISAASGFQPSSNTDDLHIGHDQTFGGSWPGVISEARVTNNTASAFTDDWIATEYNNQASPSTFYTVTDVAGGTTIDAVGVQQGQTIGNITLTQSHNLTPDSVTQGQSVDNATLTQANTLAADSLTQGQSIDNVTLTQAHIIVPNGLVQSQAIDNATLTQAHSLSLEGVTQAQTADNATLTVAGSLAVQGISQAQTIDEALLTVAGTLTLQGISQAQILDGLELTQAHILAIQGLTHSQAIDNAALTDNALALAIQSLSQGQSLDNLDLTQASVLSVNGMTQAQIIDAVTFGGLVIGELEGQIVVYAALGGTVYSFPALSGTIH